MRSLIAFLGARFEQLSSHQDHLRSLLGMADDDKDEWVQVVSGLVRRKLMQTGGRDSLGNDGSHGADETSSSQDQPTYSAALSRRTVGDVLARAKRFVDDLGAERTGPEGGIGVASYFNPWEERYACREQQLPREEFVNPYFKPRYDFVSEFTEDLSSSWHVTSTSASPPGATTAATAALRPGQGGLPKPSSGTAPQGGGSGPNLAKARRVNLKSTDPSSGSDGLRRTSKPIALAHKQAGFQGGFQAGSGSQGHHMGGHKGVGISIGGGSRGSRGGGSLGGGNKMGLMLLNVDEMQAIDSHKKSAKEKAKGRPGRKKAKIAEDGKAGMESRGAYGIAGGYKSPPSAASTMEDRLKGDDTEGSASGGADTAKQPAEADASTIPAAGEIEAAAAMMVLGVAGGDDSTGTYLPAALTGLLSNANSLQAEGMQKLENFFQKKVPEGSSQERVKYHEEVSTGDDGEQMRVTSYIRLDYSTWTWDRVHKKKRLR